MILKYLTQYWAANIYSPNYDFLSLPLWEGEYFYNWKYLRGYLVQCFNFANEKTRFSEFKCIAQAHIVRVKSPTSISHRPFLPQLWCPKYKSLRENRGRGLLYIFTWTLASDSFALTIFIHFLCQEWEAIGCSCLQRLPGMIASFSE